VSAPITQDSGQQQNRPVPPFGMRLKEQREKRGITLDQISQSTKIGHRFLEALEEDHFERLPGGIFNKGFVRAYARCVGMDEEQVVADYLTATGANQPKTGPAEEPPVIETPAETGPDRAAGLPWGIFATVLLIIAFSFAVWGFYSRVTSAREKESAPAARVQSSVPPAEPSPVSEPASPQAGNELRPSSAPPPPSGSASPPPSAIAASSGDTGARETTSTATPASRDLVLRIKAREDSWLSITVDGEVTTQQTLAASAEKTVRARNEIVIRAGNIGALDFEFKGQQLPPQGELGEVKTLAFDANGWHAVQKLPSTPESEPQP
jgi:cytoskeleton protein RodZ